MDGVKNLPKKLPESENSFQIDVVGETTGQHFTGDFTCRIPTLRHQALISKHKAFLNGDMAQYLDLTTLKLHHMISHLRYVLSASPKFWKDADSGYELLDLNVVETVYNKCLDFEESWMKAIWGDEKVEELKSKAQE